MRLQEYPAGAVGPEEKLRTGDMLVLVWAGNHDGPRMAVVNYENREGGRTRPPGWKGYWHHLTRMCGPWAAFRMTTEQMDRWALVQSNARCMGFTGQVPDGGAGGVCHASAVAYLNELRRRAAADLRAKADKLLALAGEVTS